MTMATRLLVAIGALRFLSLPLATSFAPPGVFAGARGRSHALPVALEAASGEPLNEARRVDLCIIGGGISGVAAAITAAEGSTRQSSIGDSDGRRPSILVLEAGSAVGGRVRSDYTDDGFILDRGFAVFVEEYPQSRRMLDYEALALGQFLPGARVKLTGREKLASVSDPLRRRRDILRAIFSPVGSPTDKLRLAPLFYTVMTKSIEELFAMEETDTLACLTGGYKFSEEFVGSFFAPFLEGIYLTPLESQSSRMFHFIMKMFTVGSTSLPRGGMQAVANQLGDKAKKLGADIQLCSRARSIEALGGDEAARGFLVEVESTEHGKMMVHAQSLVIAADVNVTENLLSDTDGFKLPKSSSKLPQRTVGCIYYGFRSPAPLTDPILILNGEGSKCRNTKKCPINNICFPSIVQPEYAPPGYELCSVSILENSLSEHAGDMESLDTSVRKQLSDWFPDYASDIMDESKWVQKGTFIIDNAQPSQFGDDKSASVHGGRDCSAFQGVALPRGMFVCGDHMATATFNGALESGANAGVAARAFLGI